MKAPAVSLRAVGGRVSAALLLLFATDAVLFHSSLYPSLVDPDSTTGQVENAMRNEILRQVRDRRQVLAVGHSRMALRPHIANQPENRGGYTFATIAVPGTTPRCWYYLLRDVDPTARRYAAILIPADDYNDGDLLEDLSDRVADIHYLAARLRVPDLFEFAGSYGDGGARIRAAQAVLLRGPVFRRDLQHFLRKPGERLENVRAHRLHSAEWQYGYTGDERSLRGLAVDWAARSIRYPEGLPAAVRDSLRHELLSPAAPRTGAYHRYHVYWFKRIVERYRGSGTRIVFLRLPRRPLIRPDGPAFNPEGSVRQLSRMPGVNAIGEDFFNGLERPEWFADALHLNGEGSILFTRMLTREVARLLGDPYTAIAGAIDAL